MNKCYKCRWWNYSYGCQWKKGVCHYEPLNSEWKITNTYKDNNGRVVDRVEHTDCGYIWHREMGEPLHNFCPNCGARMFAKDTNVRSKEPQTEKADRIPYDPLVEMDIKRMVEARLEQTDCAWKKGEK